MTNGTDDERYRHKKVDEIAYAVDGINWGVEYARDAFVAAARKAGGDVSGIERTITDARAAEDDDGRTLAVASGDGWSCRLLRVGDWVRVCEDAP